ncbi:MAG: ribose-phosphate pyrophosphokinase [Microscillaceae bacterium]
MSKLVFSTRKYAYLRDQLLALGDYIPGQVEVKNFPDGERYQRILNEIEGEEVILLGGAVSDEDTLEIFDLACAMEKYGAKSLTLVVPYFGYSTMERAVRSGEVVTAKTRARLFSAIPHTGRGNRILLFDLHSEGLPHYFEGNLRPVHIYCKPMVIEAARQYGGQDFILACTDAGRAKWVESLANDMGVRAAFVFKKRLSGEDTAITGINADVQGQKVVIYDDMIRTGGSLMQAARAYREAGASHIYAITTHGLFTNEALRKIQQSGLFEGICSTNTHFLAHHLASDFLQVKSIAPLIKAHI